MRYNFEGWLIKFGNVILPNSYLLADGWKSTPNQRMEADAYRDASMLLHRETSGNFKTSLTLEIRDMTLEEMSAFKNVIGLATLPESARKERRVAVTYWNDETLNYCSTEMYMPDTAYSIHYVDEEECDIEYNSFTLELIEY